MLYRCLVIITLVLGALPLLATDRTAAKASQPNIILIVTDDMRADDLTALPKTRALLGDAGLTFTHYFISTPTCCPSRTSILRGQFTHNHGVVRTGNGFHLYQKANLSRSLLPRWLQTVGYQTAMIGKFLNGYDARHDGPEPGWDRWFGVSAGGFYNYWVNDDGHVSQWGDAARDYLDDVLARKARQFLSDTDPRVPVFLYLTPKAPHGRHEPAPRYADAPVPPPTWPPSFNEADVSDKPAWVANRPPLTAAQQTEITATRKGRWRTLLALDDLVAKVMTELEQSGRLANSYVIFTSDNGWQFGEHRIPGSKGTAYDESVRVPLLIRGPGVAAGAVTDALALNADLAPTVAAWAGARTPAFVDGRSLLPLLGGATPADWRQAALLENFEDHAPGRPPYAGVRTADRLYVEYATGERELYDLAADPWALENLAGTGDPDEAELAARLAALRECAGATCREAGG